MNRKRTLPKIRFHYMRRRKWTHRVLSYIHGMVCCGRWGFGYGYVAHELGLDYDALKAGEKMYLRLRHPVRAIVWKFHFLPFMQGKRSRLFPWIVPAKGDKA